MKTSEEIDREYEIIAEEYERLDCELRMCRTKLNAKGIEWTKAKDRENEEILEINTP